MNTLMCLFIICQAGQVPAACETAYIKPSRELSNRFVEATPPGPSYIMCGSDEWVKEQPLYKELYGKK